MLKVVAAMATLVHVASSSPNRAPAEQYDWIEDAAGFFEEANRQGGLAKLFDEMRKNPPYIEPRR